MRACTLAVAKSGTVTLELALHKTPTIVHYQLSSFNYFIAKHILKLKLSHYCIVNILGNNTIFPEFIGKKISPYQLFSEMGTLLTDSDQQKKIKSACEKIKHLLGTQATHEQSAWAIQELFT